MKEQFTQGDWVNDGRTVYALKDCLWQGKQYKENIFSFNVQGKCSGKELLANAVLAKVAPKMYRLIEKLLNAGEWYTSALEFERDIDGYELASELSNLLAEARGENNE